MLRPKMRHSQRIRRRRLGTLICLASLFAFWISIRLDNKENEVKPKTILCHFTNETSHETVKYIFNLATWRNLLAKDQLAKKKHHTSWCIVPSELKLIAEAICRFYGVPDCTRLPCQMIYSSPSSLIDISCSDHGRAMKKRHVRSNEKRSKLQCKRGISLDLFITHANHSSFPSIIADPFSPIVDDLYIAVLHNQFRSCNSMWGLTFNFESLSYYPWSGDRQKLKLFDVTFGYDRSVYDFTPDPWLFNYINEIIVKSKRLSLVEVMNSKKAIHSETASDVYWPRPRRNTLEHNHTAAHSHVRSPILWMNSNCKTKSKRTHYVQQLMKHIVVDNFGTCGTNIRPLPEHIIQIQGSANRNLHNLDGYKWEAGKLALSADYLFTIAIENSRSYDYITEKLWQPLAVGSVPIYLGAPNIDDWLPCRTDCIIDLRKFKTPDDAALHIKRVAKNRTLYESYHRWREEPLPEKFEKMLKYFETMRNYSLECVLCDMSRRVDQGDDSQRTKNEIMKTVGRF